MKTAIIGAQWGDEGKGKITDFLSNRYDFVVRYQGGNNAGHTVYQDGKQYVLHLLPSGIFNGCVGVISHGVVIDPCALVKEIETIGQDFEITPKNLKLSYNCPIILKVHKLLDDFRENKLFKIGTTGRGIGPCYEDFISRKSIKCYDLLDKNNLKEKLRRILEEKDKVLDLSIEKYISEECDSLYEVGQKLAPYMIDTYEFLEKNKFLNILYEGAQGVLLDINWGTYPYVTSSNTCMGGIFTGSYIPDAYLDRILGIAKPYVTRVGEGPFPTELHDDFLQIKGNEFGATTGRKRRCGWLDLPMLAYAANVSYMTCLALTKLDILRGVPYKICTHYLYEGEKIDKFVPRLDFKKIIPVYRDMPVFYDTFEYPTFISKELTELLDLIQHHVGIPITIISYGKERNKVICL